MATHSCLLYHFIFSTKERRPLIDSGMKPRLYDYIGGVVRRKEGTLLAIGGVADHVHLLVRWRTDETIADLVRDVKAGSSGWVHDTWPEHRLFAWQSGYGAFTVSRSQQKRVEAYIANQERHHARSGYDKELIGLLEAHGIEYDPRYVLD